MPARVLCGLVIAALALATARVSARQERSVSLDEYVTALAALRTEADQLDERTPATAATLAQRSPLTWIINAPDRSYMVDGSWLITALDSWKKHPTAEAKAAIVSGLEMRRRMAETRSPSPEARPAREQLTRILAAREFSGVHGPTWFDELRARIVAFLIDLLDRFFGSSAVPTLTRLAVWGVVGLAVVMVAIALFRALRSSAVAEVADDSQPPLAARPWQTWLAEADTAAANGRWRDAVHLAYWCGVAFLEERGAWRPDRARTPREYMTLLPETQPGGVALGSLTRLFERVWYAAQPADARDFNQARSSLEQLGCVSR